MPDPDRNSNALEVRDLSRNSVGHQIKFGAIHSMGAVSAPSQSRLLRINWLAGYLTVPSTIDGLQGDAVTSQRCMVCPMTSPMDEREQRFWYRMAWSRSM